MSPAIGGSLATRRHWGQKTVCDDRGIGGRGRGIAHAKQASKSCTSLGRGRLSLLRFHLGPCRPRVLFTTAQNHDQTILDTRQECNEQLGRVTNIQVGCWGTIGVLAVVILIRPPSTHASSRGWVKWSRGQ